MDYHRQPVILTSKELNGLQLQVTNLKPPSHILQTHSLWIYSISYGYIHCRYIPISYGYFYHGYTLYLTDTFIADINYILRIRSLRIYSISQGYVHCGYNLYFPDTLTCRLATENTYRSRTICCFYIFRILLLSAHYSRFSNIVSIAESY